MHFLRQNLRTALCSPTRLLMKFGSAIRSSGNTQPNKALIWNYRAGQVGACTEADGITFRNAATGAVEGATDETWAADVETWADDITQWSSVERRKVVVCGTE